MNRKIVISILTIIFFFSSCQKERLYRKTMIVMDTVVTVTVIADSEERADRVIDRVFGELKKMEGLFNFYSDQSEISEINRNAGLKPVRVSDDTMALLKKALQISELTGGAFDISTGPLTILWDFHKQEIPDRGSIKKALKLVNFKNIVLDERNNTVFLKKKGMLIDPGGIAKGYGADRAVEILKAEGIKAALVAIAGDIRAYGIKEDRTPWIIGIRNPRSENSDDLIATLPLRDSAISTSGDYERFFIKENKRYHHIINPGTGYPSASTGGVSVIAEEGYLSDSLATAVFVLGPEKGMELLKRLGYKGIFITGDGKRFITGEIDGIKFK
ncbi:MAG: FAD:protein FMN transferase [Thermodesulfovibrionales bacterium]|nr:FAD:protein FMN transferase [Thermodesulfovibrionales bacterium]